MASKKEDNRDIFEKALQENAAQRDEIEQQRRYYLRKKFPEQMDKGDRGYANLTGGTIGAILGAALGKGVAGRLKKRPKRDYLDNDYPLYSRAQTAGLIGGGTAGAIGGSELFYAGRKSAEKKFMESYERKRRKE
jgi:hypothetical protein